jgi:DNA-directed RNA polymerase subunit RPC12/RpoP
MTCSHNYVELIDGEYICKDCGAKLRRIDGAHGCIYVEIEE